MKHFIFHLKQDILRFTEAYKVYTEAYNNANEQISQAKGHSCKEDIVISHYRNF